LQQELKNRLTERSSWSYWMSQEKPANVPVFCDIRVCI
jgi:hypothetical protein